MVEHLLLVQINQHSSLDRAPDSGALDFTRLKYDVAVRQHDRPSQGAQVRHRIQGAGEKPARKWIFKQELGHSQQLGVVVESGAEILQTAQVIRQALRLAPAAEDLPIARALRGAEHQLQPVAKIRRETIVIQQRIVHVQQKYHLAGIQHGAAFSIVGSCQVSSPPTIFTAAAGPHVPGSYCMTGTAAVRMGSITCQAASTLSSCVNSAVSPRMASPSRRS